MFHRVKAKNELNCYSYATVYTNFPVFSLVLDKDVSPEIAMTYPELYKDLTKVLEFYSKFSFCALRLVERSFYRVSSMFSLVLCNLGLFCASLCS